MPTETFLDINRRLVMRYDHADTFSFTKVRNNASDQGIFNLATAFASVQQERPARITLAVTQQLIR